MSDEGATPRELLLESCRRNNTALLLETIGPSSSSSSALDTSAVAQLLNTATDGLGQYCLHVAALYGSYDVLDTLLDQEGVEVDPTDRLEGDTPLHKAVRFVNAAREGEWERAARLVELLLDAGADPRIRNKGKLKPVELVDPRNGGLQLILQTAEFAMVAGDDVVDQDAEEEGRRGEGSASDSE